VHAPFQGRVYDAAHRAIAAVDGRGALTRTLYGADGNPVATLDPAGEVGALQLGWNPALQPPRPGSSIPPGRAAQFALQLRRAFREDMSAASLQSGWEFDASGWSFASGVATHSAAAAHALSLKDSRLPGPGAIGCFLRCGGATDATVLTLSFGGVE